MQAPLYRQTKCISWFIFLSFQLIFIIFMAFQLKWIIVKQKKTFLQTNQKIVKQK
jgi:hypothetical protein